MFVLSVTRSVLFAYPDRELSAEEVAQFNTLLERRLEYEPVAYLTGEKEFWSLMLRVTSDTLVPRPETEILVEEALKLISGNEKPKILDLGTGSGAIALAIASDRPDCHITATDISEAALAVAAKNAQRLNIDNILFLPGSWFDAITDACFDLIVTNPPYIASNDPAMVMLGCEPHNALVAGTDGLHDIRIIANNAALHLRPGGSMLIEHGADQQRAVAAILQENSWHRIRCITDLAGRPRITYSTREISTQ